MKTSIIAALNPQGIIGIDNRLPWHLPEDMKWFKSLTAGNTVIMGRNTWNSLGKGQPLYDRLNIVVSSSIYKHDCHALDEFTNTYVSPEINDAVMLADKMNPDKEIFFIGGSAIYGEALFHVTTLYLTHVKNGAHDATYNLSRMWDHSIARFPTVDLVNDWEPIASDAYTTHTSVTYIKKIA